MIKFDTSELKKAFESEKTKMQKAVRPAAQAGSQVIYEAALRNVPVGKRDHYFYGSSYKSTGQKYFFAAGSLKRSLYQVYSKDNSSQNKATYHVSWNASKAPYAWMVEFGTSRAPARPFLGPAIEESRRAAGEAIKTRFIQEVSK